jgi:hypothetical protein
MYLFVIITGKYIVPPLNRQSTVILVPSDFQTSGCPTVECIIRIKKKSWHCGSVITDSFTKITMFMNRASFFSMLFLPIPRSRIENKTRANTPCQSRGQPVADQAILSRTESGTELSNHPNPAPTLPHPPPPKKHFIAGTLVLDFALKA